MAKSPTPTTSEKDELDLRLRVTAAEMQLTDMQMKAQREDIKAIIDSHRRLMQGPLILNSGALLVLLNQWNALTLGLGKGFFAAMMSLFAIGVLVGLSALYDAIKKTTVPMKALDYISGTETWSFRISVGCFIFAIGLGVGRLWTS